MEDDRFNKLDSREIRAFKAIVEGTFHAIGDEFFQLLVKNLCAATGIPNAFVAEFTDSQKRSRVRSLAFWVNGQLLPTQEWDLEGTPCEDVLRGELCHYPSGVSDRFPKEEGIQSYIGVPLRDSDGKEVGPAPAKS